MLILLLATITSNFSPSSIYFDSVQNYRLNKGWSFWVEFVVLLIDIVIFILCTWENCQLSKLELMELAALDLMTSTSPTHLSPLHNRTLTSTEYLNKYFQENPPNHNQHHTPQISTISTSHQFENPVIENKFSEDWICASSHCQLDHKSHITHLASEKF